MMRFDRPLGACPECNNRTFQLTVTQVDRMLFDSEGNLTDKSGEDSISRLFCVGCGRKMISETSYLEHEKEAIWQEVEQRILDT